MNLPRMYMCSPSIPLGHPSAPAPSILYHVLNSLLGSVGEGEGEGGMISENGIETCIISYMKWIASPGSMHVTGDQWRNNSRKNEEMGEWHWNMYNIIYEMNHQSRFDAWYWMLGAGELRRPRGIVRGGRREGDSGWETCVYLWQIHVDVWQNQYNIVK